MLRVSCLVLTLICLVTSAAIANSEWNRRPLKGLRTVEVGIEALSSDAVRAGLLHSTIVTDVELRLRQAGIAISRAEAYSGSPFLYVRVTVLASSAAQYAYSVVVELHEPVTLVRDPAVTIRAATWQARGGIATVGSARLSESVRQRVRDAVDEFINDYLAVKPKP